MMTELSAYLAEMDPAYSAEMLSICMLVMLQTF
ncbi:hypothetical protein LSPH24S_10188 [Lysinibacillus sphaericus]